MHARYKTHYVDRTENSLLLMLVTHKVTIEIYTVNLMYIRPCISVIVEEWKTNLISLAIVFHFLCAQHVSDINISIIRSLRLFCWITTLVVLFLVQCVLEFRCGWVGVVSVLEAAPRIPLQPNHTKSPTYIETKNNTINVVIQQNSRKLLMMDILMSEICWVHKKWNKITSDIKLLFYPSTIFNSISGALSLAWVITVCWYLQM